MRSNELDPQEFLNRLNRIKSGQGRPLNVTIENQTGHLTPEIAAKVIKALTAAQPFGLRGKESLAVIHPGKLFMVFRIGLEDTRTAFPNIEAMNKAVLLLTCVNREFVPFTNLLTEPANAKLLTNDK